MIKKIVLSVEQGLYRIVFIEIIVHKLILKIMFKFEIMYKTIKLRTCAHETLLSSLCCFTEVLLICRELESSVM